MTTDTTPKTVYDALKTELLEKYAHKTPRAFCQFDGFRGHPLNGFDDELYTGWTDELMSGGPSVRILITPNTPKKDALRLIKKLRQWIKTSEVYDNYLAEAPSRERAAAALICGRCGKAGGHHPLCKTSLSDDQVRESLAAIDADDIPF